MKRTCRQFDGPSTTYPGTMIRVGVLLFVLGAGCTLVAISPLLTQADLPSIMWFLAMLMGVGFLLILFGLLGNARRRGEAVRRASSGDA